MLALAVLASCFLSGKCVVCSDQAQLHFAAMCHCLKSIGLVCDAVGWIQANKLEVVESPAFKV